MGLAITQKQLKTADPVRFRQRLDRSLEVVEQLLQRPDFGTGPASIGAELEVFLVGDNAQPLPLSSQVLDSAQDPRLALEIDQFNLECNATPLPLAGCPFATLRAEFSQLLAKVRSAAAQHHARMAVIGILPTLEHHHLDIAAMSELPRYHALDRALRSKRRSDFRLDIDGVEPLQSAWEHVVPEGANTSLQLHLKVEPKRFNAMYNAVQMATAPALAASGNSPTFLRHRLWQETRIALFKQAVDERTDDQRAAQGSHRPPPRVSFGSRWLTGGALELFTQAVQTHEPLVPIVFDEEPTVSASSGRHPALQELRLHGSTVWRWNREVYDPQGHVRIEMRSLPAGPTVPDMLANSAFLIGLSLALEPHNWPATMPFELAHRNFYRAAQHGLAAQLHWPIDGEVKKLPARDLLSRLVPMAAEGLASAGVDPKDSAPLLGIFSERVESAMTGAQWQLHRLGTLRGKKTTAAALAQLTLQYMKYSDTDIPVHKWPRTG